MTEQVLYEILRELEACNVPEATQIVEDVMARNGIGYDHFMSEQPNPTPPAPTPTPDTPSVPENPTPPAPEPSQPGT